jgi:hypothetical protein
MPIIGMARAYRRRPSELMGIDEDSYTAYCLDEACYYIQRQIEEGFTPVFEQRVQSLRKFYGELMQT